MIIMVKITIYNLTPLSNRTFELLKIMTGKVEDNDKYFMLYTQDISRPHMKHKHYIGPDAELIFVDNLMNIIHPHSCSVIDLSREQGYKIETKMIGE